MKKSSLPFQAFLQATGLVLYIGVLVAFMNYFGNHTSAAFPSVYGPVVLLLLFILSALISGGLVLGRAGLLFWDKKRCQAVTLVGWTAGWIAVYLGILLAIVLAKA